MSLTSTTLDILHPLCTHGCMNDNQFLDGKFLVYAWYSHLTYEPHIARGISSSSMALDHSIQVPFQPSTSSDSN
jgi:hypothetical protein